MKILNFDSTIATVSAGTAAAPSISFANDPNTGIYSPGADQVAISTGGTGRLFVDSSGRLGLGTSTVGTRFHIAGETDPTIRINTSENGDIWSTANRYGTIQFYSQDYEYGGGGEMAAISAGVGSNFGNVPSLRFSVSAPSGGAANPAERMRLTQTGLGIGTTGPQAQLHVEGTSRFVATNSARFNGTAGTYTTWLHNDTAVGDIGTGNQTFSGGSTTDFAITSRSATSLVFGTNTTERARIDSSGRLLVGTASARDNFFNAAYVTSRFQVEGTATANSSISCVSNNSSGNNAALILAKSNGASVGSNTLVGNGDVLGGVYILGSDGTEFVAAASITGEVDGTPGANDMPGRLVFSTTADGASSPTERMRITNAGFHVFGGGALESNGTVTLYPNNSNGAALMVWNRASTTNTSTALAFRDGGAPAVGSITYTNTATAYNTSSDYRLKENVTAVTDGITRLQQLKPSRFNFIADPDKTVDGFIAHEVQTIVPEAITGEKDAVDDEGNPVYQGIDQSKLVPLLTAALQEAIGEIESLKARVAALEAS